jgi:uncharacterized membrane protein
MPNESTTVVLGIPIPSTDPLFLPIVGVHVMFGLGAVTAGAIAMLSNKGRGRHSNWGTTYFWFLLGVFVTMSVLSFMRLGGELSLVHFGRAVIRVCAFRTYCRSAALAAMAQAASHWHGRVVYFAADCVLRGQRQEPTAMERTSSNRVLVLAKRSRRTGDRICPAAASGDPWTWSIRSAT